MARKCVPGTDKGNDSQRPSDAPVDWQKDVNQDAPLVRAVGYRSVMQLPRNGVEELLVDDDDSRCDKLRQDDPGICVDGVKIVHRRSRKVLKLVSSSA